MIRIKRSTHKQLRNLAAYTGKSVSVCAAIAVEEYERKLFWQKVNDEFAALRQDTVAWKHELEERAAWDGAT
jgi:hypothetical protein